MIEVKNINKTFQEKAVLKNINGKFEQGKTNLIIGASGTGKSVLLKCIVGLVKPESGSVLYDNRDFVTGDEDLKKDIRREMGMLFQGGALFDSKTVEQNVMCCAWQPFFTTDHICDLHEMVVNYIGEMVGWETIRFQKNFIIELSAVENYFASYFIVNDDRLSRIYFETDNKWHALFKLIRYRI